MKYFILILIIGFAFPGPGFADDMYIHPSDEVSPEMLGLQTYVTEATPPAGKVFVVRQEERFNNKVKSISEAIVYTAGGKIKLTVIYFDSGAFIFATPEMKQNPQVTIKTQITGASSAGFVSVVPIPFPGGRGYGPGVKGPRFYLHNDKGDTTVFDYSAFIEDYDVAKKRNPTLPAIKPGETWGLVNKK